MAQRTLDQVLETHGATRGIAGDVAGVVAGIGRAAKALHDLITTHDPKAAANGAANELTATADKLVTDALGNSAAAGVATRADAAPRTLGGKSVLVTIDVLGGGAGLDANLSPGLVFSLWPVTGSDLAAAAGQPGRAQLASGFVMFGPRTVLALTLGKGTSLFQLDTTGAFVETDATARLPHGTREYAIDASAYRHWDSHVRAFIDQCVEGAEGPAGVDFTMRWSGSLVSEAYRILRRGGVFLQPKNGSTDSGGASLIFDAAPLAFLIEEAGGEATTGYSRILDIAPRGRDHSVTLIFGSTDHVGEVTRSYNELSPASHRAPLFGARGLFRE